jgi:hypothetical protein
MLWWYIILAVSTGAAVLAAVSAYLRVRSHMKKAAKDTSAKE